MPKEINESILNEEILEDMKKKRVDHMKYMDDMEVLEDSTVMDQVISAMNQYDYSKYTAAQDVHWIKKRKGRKNLRHCFHRQPIRSWKKWRKKQCWKQESILETAYICLPHYTYRIIVKITVFTADLTAIIKSNVPNWIWKALRKKWKPLQRAGWKKF